MLIFVVQAVFIAGLMVGRTPEYLGKKIEAYDVKMAMLYVLIFPLIILSLTAVFVLLPNVGLGTTNNPGPHGFSEVLYAFTSGAGNNGSAFAGLGPNWWWNIAMGWDMLFGRFLMMLPVLALAGNIPREYTIVHGAPGRRGFDSGRTYLLPGIEPGTDSGAPAAEGRSVVLAISFQPSALSSLLTMEADEIEECLSSEETN
jgi:K+-transporting ATPase ATPase A chain